MAQSQVSIAALPRSLSVPETWGLGFGGLLLWLGTVTDIHAALGKQAFWIWLPGTIVGVLLNLQIKRLGQYFPNVVGGTPNYTTRLLERFPGLARYSAIGYLLGWVSVPAINAVILSELIEENLKPLELAFPIDLLKVGFTILPFIIALSGIRTLGTLHAFFVFPAIGFLTTFCVQGIGWLTFSPHSPGLFTDITPNLSVIDWMKWFFISTYAVYSCETASSFVAESRQPKSTLHCLTITAGFIPIIFLMGSWVITRLAIVPISGDTTYFSLMTAASPFWQSLAPALVTFLITSGCLLSSTTAVSNCPRIIYQLAADGYIAPVFAVVSRRGVPEPGLILTFLLSLICLLYGNVTHIVMITGTGYLLSIIAVHFGLWLIRNRPATRWAGWSLFFCLGETVVLIVGGLAWGWIDLSIGLLLPLIISIFAKSLSRLNFALCQPHWWQQRDRVPEHNSTTDLIALQVITLILLVSGALSIGWLVRAGLEHNGMGHHLALFSILLMTVSFVGVAIACWTSLSQITRITEAQTTVARTLKELQETEVALQQLNQELEQRVQERTEKLQQEVHRRQQAELKFQRIFHTSPHAIAIATLADRYIIDLNNAFAQLFGYSHAEMLGHYADEFQLFSNPANQGMVQRQLMNDGSVHNLECEIRTKTGEIKTVIASAGFIEVNDISCFLVTGNDISDRKRIEAALQQSEARFQKIAAASPAQIHILVTHADTSLIRFEYISPAVWELRELQPEQLLQDPSPVYDQIHPDDRAEYFAALQQSLANMEPFFHEYRIIPPSGQVRWIRVNTRPERQENDEIFWYGIVLDVSDRKQIEEQLRVSLKEKEVLLREVYHRVKNNMQLVSSLLNLQANIVNDPTVLKVLNDSQQRVKAMALIHERLYRSTDLARISVANYIPELVNNLVRSYTNAGTSIHVTFDIDDLELELDIAIPCGLLINELVSNALKYAFPEHRGEIKLGFKLDDFGNYCLIVKDDGIGIPSYIDLQNTESLGMQLVYGLATQIKGTIAVDRNQGGEFKITFSKGAP